MGMGLICPTLAEFLHPHLPLQTPDPKKSPRSGLGWWFRLLPSFQGFPLLPKHDKKRKWKPKTIWQLPLQWEINKINQIELIPSHFSTLFPAFYPFSRCSQLPFSPQVFIFSLCLPLWRRWWRWRRTRWAGMVKIQVFHPNRTAFGGVWQKTKYKGRSPHLAAKF